MRPVQPVIPRGWPNRPTYQVVQAGFNGVPNGDAQYVLQAVIPSSMNVVNKQPQTLLTVLPQLQQRERINQVDHLVRQPESISVERQKLDIRPVHVVSGVEKQDQIKKQGVTAPVQHSSHKVIIEENARHVPVVSGQRVIGYQLIENEAKLQSEAQPQRQSQPQISNQQIRQQNVQYVPYIVQQIPNHEVQQYYQTVGISIHNLFVSLKLLKFSINI